LIKEGIIMEKSFTREEGQGLVEYALILVLVAIVVIAILLQLGPVVGNVFSSVVAALGATGSGGGSGSITSVGASWNGPVVNVNVTVSEPATVSISVIQGSGTTAPSSRSCTPGTPCTFNITSPSNGGMVRASAGGGSMTATWPSL
jgi:pilus assembly protein Flp/PilA